jgi:hypothetical protein
MVRPDAAAAERLVSVERAAAQASPAPGAAQPEAVRRARLKVSGRAAPVRVAAADSVVGTIGP